LESKEDEPELSSKCIFFKANLETIVLFTVESSYNINMKDIIVQVTVQRKKKDDCVKEYRGFGTVNRTSIAAPHERKMKL
jgi:hypothetical protein